MAMSCGVARQRPCRWRTTSQEVVILSGSVPDVWDSGHHHFRCYDSLRTYTVHGSPYSARYEHNPAMHKFRRDLLEFAN